MAEKSKMGYKHGKDMCTMPTTDKSGETTMIQIKSVLVPVDGSPPSRRAAMYAAELVNAIDPVLYLLHVHEAIPKRITGDPGEMLRKEEEEKALALLESYREMLAAFDLRITLLVRSGRPAYEILSVQEEIDCDLIVMGSRGLSSLENVIFGSVVSQVLQGVTCPILVTRNLAKK